MSPDTDPDTNTVGYSATAGGNLVPNCEQDIFERGTVVEILLGSSDQNEELVRHVRAQGFRIDWHLVGGQGVVKTLSDPQAVRAAIDRSLKVLGWT